MAKLTASGETAIRARNLKRQASEIEAQARASKNDGVYRELMERASALKDEALDLEKSSRWFAYLDLIRFGPKAGKRTASVEKSEFLRRVAAEIGHSSREALAAECLQNHSVEVYRLWRARGEKARSKLLDFMKNHKVP